ncbi:MAG TPA: hypothetical protein VNZ47_04180 [Candidatus Dormibacteraeota bacterium]|nr:hypothetical protein [Candidatus Dormibacteraeota bacterium]
MSHHLYALFFIALLAGTALAQKTKHPATADDLSLIERAADHELIELESPALFQYQERLEWSWGTETRSVIETPEGRADRIVLFNDEPLSPDHQAKQQHRLEQLLSDRDAVKNDLKDQRAETQRRARMVKAFPKAFFFDFAGWEKGLLRFNFRPDPKFSPKDRETQMYRGMEGTVWIEPVQERIVQIQGKLVKDVTFGWGIFGRLKKGGIYEITQTQLSPGRWRITALKVDVKGKAFLVDTFRVLRNETNSRFRPVSSAMTYQAAVKALLTVSAAPDEERLSRPPVLSKRNPHKGD